MTDIRPDGPPREGVRGGLEQFRWESIKGISYKDREQYLGHSARVGTLGRFQRWGRNDWWRKSRGDSKQIQNERNALQEFEKRVMDEAMGKRPKHLLLMKDSELSAEQVANLTRNDVDKVGESSLGAEINEETERLKEEASAVHGVGFRPWAKEADYIGGGASRVIMAPDGSYKEVSIATNFSELVKEEGVATEKENLQNMGPGSLANSELWSSKKTSVRVKAEEDAARDRKKERRRQRQEKRHAKELRKKKKALLRTKKHEKSKPSAGRTREPDRRVFENHHPSRRNESNTDERRKRSHRKRTDNEKK